jgi:succinate-semialdehyde dehydrogenase/glutarate-semialdehyde dehydrogenase
VQKGAQVVLGGRRNGNFFEPTVLVNVDHSMKVMRDETFGPLLPVMKVRDEAEAIALANDNEYGLAGAVWTRDLQRGERVARELELGSVVVNDTLVQYAVPLLPFGGVRQSGNARTHCREEVTQFTKTRSYAIGAAPPALDPAALFRYKGAYHLISASLHLLLGVTPQQRLHALPEFARHVQANLRRAKPNRLAVATGKSALVAGVGAVAAGTIAAVSFAVLRGRRR